MIILIKSRIFPPNWRIFLLSWRTFRPNDDFCFQNGEFFQQLPNFPFKITNFSIKFTTLSSACNRLPNFADKFSITDQVSLKRGCQFYSAFSKIRSSIYKYSTNCWTKSRCAFVIKHNFCSSNSRDRLQHFTAIDSEAQTVPMKWFYLLIEQNNKMCVERM